MEGIAFTFQPKSFEHFLKKKNKEHYEYGYYEEKESIVFQNSHYIEFYLPNIHNEEKRIANFLISNNFLLFNPRYFNFDSEKKDSLHLRGINCLHVDTVVLERFMHHNKLRNDFFTQNKPDSNWSCPICKKPMPLESIRISIKVMEIIEECRTENITKYFIVYNRKNRKFNYFVINDDSTDMMEQNLLNNGISKAYPFPPKNSQNESYPVESNQSIFEEEPSEKRAIESSHICLINYFVSDNLTKFLINFDHPEKDNGKYKVYIPIIIPLPKKERFELFEKFQIELKKNSNQFVTKLNKNTDQLKEAVFLFPGIFEDDFRYLSISRILFEMTILDGSFNPFLTFLKSSTIPIEDDSMNDFIKKINTTNNPDIRLIDVAEILNITKKDFYRMIPNNLYNFIYNFFIRDQKLISYYKMESKSFLKANNKQTEYSFFDRRTVMNESLQVPSISYTNDNIIVTFYQNLKEFNLNMSYDKKYFMQINSPNRLDIGNNTFSYQYQLVLSLDIVKNFINSKAENNGESVVIVLSSKKILNSNISQITPPHITSSSIEFSDTIMTTLIYGLHFFLCDTIIIDLVTGKKEEEEKLFEKFVELRKSFQGLITKPILIISQKDEEVEQMLQKLEINPQNDLIEPSHSQLDYYVVHNVYAPKKKANFRGLAGNEQYLTLFKKYVPFEGRRFISENPKSIASAIEFTLKEFSKFDISVQSSIMSFDSYTFSIKAQLYA